MPTQTKENYLKAIFSISQEKNIVTISELAETMGVSKPTVNSMVKKMKEKGWLIYEKYKPLKLTPKGKNAAALIIRKHRLTEMFLSTIMDFGWEEVHEIAEEMEHLQSIKLFDRMDEILGFPTEDPHGSPIPDKSGKIANPSYLNLTALKAGESGKLCGIMNSSKDLLLYLNKKKIKLGSILKVIEIEEFDSSTELLIKKGSSVILNHNVCKCLLVDKI